MKRALTPIVLTLGLLGPAALLYGQQFHGQQPKVAEAVTDKAPEVDPLAACINEVVELEGKIVKLRELRPAVVLLEEFKYAHTRPQSVQAYLGLKLLLNGPLIPLRAEQAADQAMMKTRAIARELNPTLAECREWRVRGQREWLCPSPNSDGDNVFARSDHESCVQTWRTTLTADERALLDAEDAKRETIIRGGYEPEPVEPVNPALEKLESELGAMRTNPDGSVKH